MTAQVIVDLTGDASRLQKAYDVAERSDKGLRDSIASTGKAGQSAAETISREFDKSGDKSAKAFNVMLRELRKTGPEGRKAAADVERHLRATGQAGRKSFEDVVASLGKLDDESAKVARNATADFKRVEESGDGAFGEGALAKVTALASGFFTVGTAVSKVNEFFREQAELAAAARDAQVDLASSQADAAKNLIGLSELERSELLRNGVSSIARETGFSDIGGITAAIGSGRSAGGTPAQVLSAVHASAMLTALTPGSIDEYTGASIDLAKATGSDDAQKNLSLLLSTGTQSRVADPLALAKELAPAVNNAVLQAKGDDPLEASREAAALYATLTQAANDTTGAPSRTATIQLSSRLGQFFGDLDEQRLNARSAIQSIDKKKNPVEKDFVRKERLQAFLESAEGMQDPGSLFGRLEALSEKPAVKAEFFSTEFGEAAYKTAFKELTDSTTDLSAGLRAAKDAIRADARIFAEEVKSERNLTPQLRVGMLDAQSDTNLALLETESTEAAKLSQVRTMVADTLAKTRADTWAEWLFQSTAETGITSGSLRGITPVEEAVSGIEKLQNRRIGPLRDGIIGDDAAQLRAIAGQVSTIEGFVTSEIETGNVPRSVAASASARARAAVRRHASAAASPELLRDQPLQAQGYAENARAMQRLADVLERVAGATERTADNTGKPEKLDMPNYSAAQQSAMSQAAMP